MNIVFELNTIPFFFYKHLFHLEVSDLVRVNFVKFCTTEHINFLSYNNADDVYVELVSLKEIPTLNNHERCKRESNILPFLVTGHI